MSLKLVPFAWRTSARKAKGQIAFGKLSISYSPAGIVIRGIKGALADSLGTSAAIVYLQADVCREELLVEIEATGEQTES